MNEKKESERNENEKNSAHTIHGFAIECACNSRTSNYAIFFWNWFNVKLRIAQNLKFYFFALDKMNE